MRTIHPCLHMNCFLDSCSNFYRSTHWYLQSKHSMKSTTQSYDLSLQNLHYILTLHLRHYHFHQQEWNLQELRRIHIWAGSREKATYGIFQFFIFLFLHSLSSHNTSVKTLCKNLIPILRYGCFSNSNSTRIVQTLWLCHTGGLLLSYLKWMKRHAPAASWGITCIRQCRSNLLELNPNALSKKTWNDMQKEQLRWHRLCCDP